jgi:vitamin B12 transporter
MRHVEVTIFLIVLGFLSSPLRAQGKMSNAKPAVISGTVKDENEKPVSYANVFIANTGEGQVTNDDGSFSFTSSAAGSAELVASAVGFGKYTRTISVTEGRSYKFSIVLKESQIAANNVDVTASSFSSEPGKGLAVTQMDVYTTPGGAADIFQSMKTLPGLTQVSESSELYVRGGDPSETVVLVDQASLYNPYTYESPYGGLFSNLSTAAIGGMYFSSGGFSVKYGNALSGVLDLKTKGIPAARSFQFGASLAGASAGVEIPVVEDEIGFRFYARKNFTAPIFWLNGGSDRFSAVPSSQDAQASADYEYSQTGKFKLFALASSDNEGVNVERPEINGVFTGKSRDLTFNLQHSDMIGGDLLVETSISGSDYSDTWLLGVLNLDKVDRTRKIRTDLQDNPMGDLKISAGGEVEYRQEKYKGTIPNYDYDLRTGASSKVLDVDFSATRYGAYCEVEKRNLAALRGLFAVAGVRGDYVGTIGTYWFDPRITAGYSLSSVSTLRFSAGLFHEYPDARLYSATDGNPRLLPMKATHFVLGYDYTPWEGTEFRIEAYEKDYADLPDSNAATNFDNSGYGYARGLDVIAKGDLPFGLSGWVSYGYIDTKRKWYESVGMAPSPYDITNNFTLVAKYNLADAWQVGIDFKYATGMPYTPVTSAIYVKDLNVYQPVYGPSYSARYPNYRRLDIRLTRLARLFGKYFTVIYVEGLNILNIHNNFSYAYSPDYSTKTGVESFFGRRTIVVGVQITAE